MVRLFCPRHSWESEVSLDLLFVSEFGASLEGTLAVLFSLPLSHLRFAAPVANTSEEVFVLETTWDLRLVCNTLHEAFRGKTSSKHRGHGPERRCFPCLTSM